MKTTTLNIGGTITILGVLIASFAKIFSNSLAGSSEFAILATSLATAATFFALVYIDYRNVNRANQYLLSRPKIRNTTTDRIDRLGSNRELNKDRNAIEATQRDAA